MLSGRNKNIKNSIKLRLILSYALTSIFILVIAFFCTYGLLQQRIQQDNSQFMLDTLNLVKTNISDELIPHSHQRILHALKAFNFNKYELQLIDTNGNIIFESENFPRLSQAIRNKLIFFDINSNVIKHSDNYVFGHKTFDLMSTFCGMGRLKRKPVLIIISYDVSHRIEILRTFQLGLFTFLVIGVLVSIIFSFIIASQGLEPLKRMNEKLKLINVFNLHQRIVPTGWPSEMEELAMTLDTLLGELEQGFNRLSRFASDLAHELRTPITNLRIETEVLLQRERDLPIYIEALGSKLEEYQRLSEMIERILLLAQVENPQMRLEYTTFDVRSEIQELLSFFEPLVEESDITIQIEGNANIRADKTLFDWAINNIISNACKYNKEHGTINIKILQLQDHNTKRVIISIADTGMGIDEADLPNVFERFYRADLSRSQQINGYGLGLSIVKTIIELHQANISIMSTLGKGTTVTLEFYE